MFQTNYERVCQYIEGNPGCHFRKIKKDLALSVGTIQYQLNKLEKDGKIISISKSFYKYYFPNGIFQEHEKEILQILSHKSMRKILLYIIEKKNPTKSDMITHLHISYSSLNWHLERLISYNVILETQENKCKRYSINDHFIDISQIIKLLRNYYLDIWNSWSNRLAEVFLLLSNEYRSNR